MSTAWSTELTAKRCISPSCDTTIETITFTGANCGLGNGVAATGIAYYDATTRSVMVMAMNAAKSDGFIYVGQK